MTKEELEAKVVGRFDGDDVVHLPDALAYAASERAAGEIAGLEGAHKLIDHLGSRGLVAAEIARRRAEQAKEQA
jgi:hypothetical protein